MRLRIVTFCLMTLFILAIIFSACGPQTSSGKEEEYAKGTKEGYELAKYYCANCHLFVPAKALDRQTWKKHVLPDMATQLGIEVMWKTEYIQGNGALLSFKDWLKIVDYYVKSAPEKLTIPKSEPVITDTTLFTVRQTNVAFAEPVKTTMTVIDPVTKDIYTSDANTEKIYRWNNKLELTDSVKIFSPAVSAYFYNDEKGKRQSVITSIGTILAVDVDNGKILHFETGKKLGKPADSIAIELPRPTESIPADFNNDGLTDWLVCAFGRSKGGLYIYNKLPGQGYEKKTIVQVPGALQAIAEDFNKDGWMDFMVLFAHEEESIRLYTNNKDGSFTETRLLSFPPMNGSTSFQLVDFNNDGLKDILYTCGDNADVSKIFKPFHGVYIYTNKGNNKYEQAWFYHINGCSKAIAADFDNDGDLDIATIAFYADFINNPAEKFIYLRQDAQMKFQPLTPPLEHAGRWLTMDVNDYDGDGDMDILLGNFSKGFFIEKDFTPTWDLYKPITILENKMKKN